MPLINVRVARITEEACGIRSFVLAKSGFMKLPRYTPGSHIDVHCGEGIIRQYSLCGDPDDRRHLMIAVKQGEPARGGSRLMHTEVNVGDKMEIGSPRNNFSLDEAVTHAVLLAAGIGITPIVAIADRLHALGKSFELHYFSRGPAYTAFQNRLQHGTYAKNVTFHQGLDVTDTQSALRKTLGVTHANGQLYLCGPGPFMDMAEAMASEAWPTEAIHLERFAANPALSGKSTHPFEVELGRTGTVLTVGAQQTILDVLEANNIDAAFSCEQGVCGTCVTEVIHGTPEHRDSFLSSKQKTANTRMCICVSRAQSSRLVLDL